MIRVLVVDDDATIRELVAEVLVGEGYTVETAANGQAALTLVRGRWPPDAIVSDLMMPVLDGWGFIERCRQEPGCDTIPILVLSAAHDRPGSAERLRRQGVQAVLAKPFDLDALVASLEWHTRPRDGRSGPEPG